MLSAITAALGLYVLSKQVFRPLRTGKHVEISLYGNHTLTTDDADSGRELKQTFTMV